MEQDAKQDAEKPRKKEYRRPRVESARAHERKALACGKTDPGTAPECGIDFFS